MKKYLHGLNMYTKSEINILNIVEKSYHEVLRSPASGHGSITAKLIKDSKDITIYITESTDWNLYRGSFKGWAADVYDISVRVQRNWKKLVYDRGLATAGGMLTLAARKVSESGGITIYKATWSRQSRGYSTHIDHGYIATDGIVHYHASTKAKALAGIHRKIKSVAISEGMPIDKIEQFCARYIKKGFYVSLDDARKVGACEPGIESWCAKNNIDIDRKQIPATEAIAAYRNNPIAEARAAILYAARHATN